MVDISTHSPNSWVLRVNSCFNLGIHVKENVSATLIQGGLLSDGEMSEKVPSLGICKATRMLHLVLRCISISNENNKRISCVIVSGNFNLGNATARALKEEKVT